MRKTISHLVLAVSVVLGLASLFGITDQLVVGDIHAQDTIRSLTKTIEGRPVAAGANIFWFQRNGSSALLSIHGYNSDLDRPFRIPGRPVNGSSLAADGTTVAWVERVQGGEERVQGYNVRTGQVTTLLPTAERDVSGLALDRGRLLYQDANPEHRGIYAYTIATGQEQQLSPTGQNPVAADGIILWSEQQFQGRHRPARWTLYMRHTDGTGRTRLLASDRAPFSGYSVSGDQIVWSFFPPAVDRRVHLYRISTETRTPISSEPARYPIARGNTIVWTSEPPAVLNRSFRWSVQSYRSDLRTTSTVVAEATGAVTAWAILGQTDVVLSVDNDTPNGNRELRVEKLARPRDGANPQPEQPAVAPESAASTFSACALPLQCGQIYRSGYALYDAGGRWPVNGVHFFLPEFGINTWTFYDGNYAGASTSIDRWLDVARDYLSAKTLRIFVELPTGTTTPTSHATIYDFAQRANKRGMRLGLVLHNSSDFRMTPERRAWLNGLVTYFGDRRAKSMIAYVSAGNEINNWCGGQDCFDNNQAYVDAANDWVAQFSTIFRDHNSGILTTVGLSTEVADSDDKPATSDFVKEDRTGRTLAGTVDFISPHNYGGGSYAIYDELRYRVGYQGPIVLEEYGFPTDPQSNNAFFTEGESICRYDPWNAACTNTAPYFVEINTQAIRQLDFAGGVAWMLADIAVKRCDRSPSDLWTGLFMAGSGYCGGTRTANPPGDKATAFRIKQHHAVYGHPVNTPTPSPTATKTPTPTRTPTATCIPSRTATRTRTPIATRLPAKYRYAIPFVAQQSAVGPCTSRNTNVDTIPARTATPTHTLAQTVTPRQQH